jgi:MFS family permease
VLLWFADPVMRDEAAEPIQRALVDGEPVDDAGVGAALPRVARSVWFRPRFIVICLAAAATTLVLGGTDIAIVAALREFGAQPSIGWVLAVWGFGSLVGGLVYGGVQKSISAFWLLGGLAVVSAPMAFATGVPTLALLSFVAGLVCAPTITATVDQVSRVVPAAARGEAMGWHGSSMTGGLALGAPLAGFAIDHQGWQAGFLVVAVIGLLVALVGAAATSGRATQRRAAHRLRETADA